MGSEEVHEVGRHVAMGADDTAVARGPGGARRTWGALDIHETSSSGALNQVVLKQALVLNVVSDSQGNVGVVQHLGEPPHIWLAALRVLAVARVSLNVPMDRTRLASVPFETAGARGTRETWGAPDNPLHTVTGKVLLELSANLLSWVVGVVDPRRQLSGVPRGSLGSWRPWRAGGATEPGVLQIELDVLQSVASASRPSADGPPWGARGAGGTGGSRLPRGSRCASHHGTKLCTSQQ